VSLSIVLFVVGVIVGASLNDQHSSGSSTQLSIQEAASLRDSCGAQELLIGVRGSGETSDQGGGLGNTIDSVYHQASSHLRTGQLVAQPVDYIASSVRDLRVLPMYIQSYTQGREQLYNTLYLWSKKCSNYRFVIAGFSQGADVAADVVTGLSPSIPVENDILGKIDAVALFGDPRYNPGDSRVDAVHGLQLSGVRASDLAAHLPFPMSAQVRPLFPDSLANRTRSWCQAIDPVCAFDASKFTDCLNGNVFRIRSIAEVTVQCAGKWKSLVEPHLRYAEAGITDTAGIWISDRIKSGASGAQPTEPPAITPPVAAAVPTTPRGKVAPPIGPPVAVQPAVPVPTPAAPPQPVEVDPNPPPTQDPNNQPPLPPDAHPLAGVDLERYCGQWPRLHAALRYQNTWGWRCGYESTGGWRSTDQNISVLDACVMQYGSGAISHYDNYLDPTSWRCWR